MIFHFYSPSHFEKWDYRNPLEQGIGGSETAHIECAIRLAARGHKVFSYSPLPKDQIVGVEYKGVQWFDIKDADFSLPDIWVIGRWPQIADKFRPKTKDQKLWLVMQDTWYPELKKNRALKFDLLLPLCSTQKTMTENTYPYMKDKIVQSANGIRTDIIESLPSVERDPYRIVFASSPDRGLINLLKIFPRILQAQPKASLHIYYGLDNIEKVTRDDDSIDDAGTTRKQLIAISDQPNVFWEGRKPQIELYTEYLKSGIWAYPTRFTETSCITSMETQALGCIPITNPLWALKDNVMEGSLIDGDPTADGLTRNRYIKEILYWMQYGDSFSSNQKSNINNLGKNMLRENMMAKARVRFDWERVIDQYEKYANI